MQSLHSRKQLATIPTPHARSEQSPSHLELGAKRKAPVTPPAEPPKLVTKSMRRQLVVARSESSLCAQGCLHKNPDHTGLCLTEQGAVPSSVKAAWIQAKLNLPSEKRRPIAFPQLGDAAAPQAV